MSLCSLFILSLVLLPSSLSLDPGKTLPLIWVAKSIRVPRNACYGNVKRIRVNGLEQMMPIKEVCGRLYSFTLMVRESPGSGLMHLEQLMLCRDWETTRLLTFGWYREYSVLLRILELCNKCIGSVTNIRVLQHTGLTADGLRDTSGAVHRPACKPGWMGQTVPDSKPSLRPHWIGTV